MSGYAELYTKSSSTSFTPNEARKRGKQWLFKFSLSKRTNELGRLRRRDALVVCVQRGGYVRKSPPLLHIRVETSRSSIHLIVQGSREKECMLASQRWARKVKRHSNSTAGLFSRSTSKILLFLLSKDGMDLIRLFITGSAVWSRFLILPLSFHHGKDTGTS